MKNSRFSLPDLRFCVCKISSVAPIDDVYLDLSSLIEELRANSDHMMKTIETGLRGVVEKGPKEFVDPLAKTGAKEDPTSNSGLFSKLKGLFGNTNSKEQVYLKADLGKDSSAMHYDPIKKKYVFHDDPEETEEQVVRPPPPKVDPQKPKTSAISSATSKKTNMDDLLRPRQLQTRGGSATTTKDKSGPKVIKTAAFASGISDGLNSDDVAPGVRHTFNDLITKIRTEIASHKSAESETPKKNLRVVEEPEIRRSPQRPDRRQEELEAAYQEVLSKLLSMPKYIQELHSKRSLTHVRKEDSKPLAGNVGTQTDQGAVCTEETIIDRLEWLLNSAGSHSVGKLISQVMDELVSIEKEQNDEFLQSPDGTLAPNNKFIDFVLLLVHRHKKSRSQLAEYELRTEEMKYLLENIHSEWTARGERLREAEFHLVKYYMLLDRKSREVEVKKAEVEALKQAYRKEKEEREYYTTECDKLASASKSLGDALEKQKNQVKKLTLSLEQAKSLVEGKQSDISGLQHKVALLEDENHRMHKVHREALTEKQHLKISLEKVQSELTVLTEKYYDTIHKSNTLLDTLQGERESGVRNLRMDKEKLMAECDKLAQEVSRKDRKIRDLEEEVSYVQKKSKEMETDKEKQVQELKARISAQEADMHNINAAYRIVLDMSNHQLEVKRLRETLSELKESSLIKTEILEEKEREMSKLQKKFQEAEVEKQTQVNALKSTLAQAQAALASQNEKIQSLTSSLQSQTPKMVVPPSPKGQLGPSKPLFAPRSSMSSLHVAPEQTAELSQGMQDPSQNDSQVSGLTSQLRQAHQELESMRIELKAMKQRLPKSSNSPLNTSGSEGRKNKLFSRVGRAEGVSPQEKPSPEEADASGLAMIRTMNDLRNENFALKSRLEEVEATLQQSNLDMETLKQNGGSALRRSVDRKADEEEAAQLEILESEVVRLQTSLKLSESKVVSLEEQLCSLQNDKELSAQKMQEAETRQCGLGFGVVY